jgi:hypothetical protein
VRQYSLKEQNTAGSRDSEPSAPPYEGKFSHKIKIQSKDGMDSDLVSDEEGQEDIPAHQALRTMHLGYPPQVKRFPTLAKSPLQAALQAAHSQGEDTAGFKFYPVLERLDPNDPAMQQIFFEKIPFKSLKDVKQVCTMYGFTMPGYYRVW